MRLADWVSNAHLYDQATDIGWEQPCFCDRRLIPKYPKGHETMKPEEILAFVAKLVVEIGPPAVRFLAGLLRNLRDGKTMPDDFANLVSHYQEDIAAIVRHPAIVAAREAAADAVEKAEDALT